VRTTPLKSMDQTRRLAEVALDGVVVGEEALLGALGGGWRVIERLADRAKVALCAEMCGGAQRVLDMSVDYAKVREQFGKPIGSFQAIQHKCANMMVQVESSKSATYYAAWAVANDVEEAPLAAAMAKAYCSDAYRMVAGEGIQIHGGIGFTWEHDMHIYFKRAKSSEVTFGDATWNRELVAQRIL
jgi:alkylation response protein AidB-like acyl-CoA dehydrogenase